MLKDLNACCQGTFFKRYLFYKTGSFLLPLISSCMKSNAFQKHKFHSKNIGCKDLRTFNGHIWETDLPPY